MKVTREKYICGERCKYFITPGQPVQLIYTRGEPRARAWGLPDAMDARTVNVRGYQRLLMRAVETVIEPVTGLDVTWLTHVKQLVLLDLG